MALGRNTDAMARFARARELDPNNLTGMDYYAQLIKQHGWVRVQG